jgi:hypothetical protein
VCLRLLEVHVDGVGTRGGTDNPFPTVLLLQSHTGVVEEAYEFLPDTSSVGSATSAVPDHPDGSTEAPHHAQTPHRISVRAVLELLSHQLGSATTPGGTVAPPYSRRLRPGSWTARAGGAVEYNVTHDLVIGAVRTRYKVQALDDAATRWSYVRTFNDSEGGHNTPRRRRGLNANTGAAVGESAHGQQHSHAWHTRVGSVEAVISVDWAAQELAPVSGRRQKS